MYSLHIKRLFKRKCGSSGLIHTFGLFKSKVSIQSIKAKFQNKVLKQKCDTKYKSKVSISKRKIKVSPESSQQRFQYKV